MLFYPKNAQVPEILKTDEFMLRPLRATDVELDYDAVMSSKTMLRVWGQGEWPTDNFTLAENLKDLQEHEQEHIEGVAFTFTVMNPSQTECLGCVYINPLSKMFNYIKVKQAQIDALTNYQATVGFWVRQSRLVDNLDQRLLEHLIKWFQNEWQFSCILFNANTKNKRQIKLLSKTSLQKIYEFPLPNKKTNLLFYG